MNPAVASSAAPSGRPTLPPSIVFIFGGSGDLNLRKLTPALFNLSLDGYLPEQFAVVGLGRSTFTDDSFRDRLLAGVNSFSRRKQGPDGAWARFAPCLHWLQLDGGDAAHYLKITEFVTAREAEWGQPANVLFYLSVAPQLVPEMTRNLATLPFAHNKERVRIVFEKPFGHDRQSARELNDLIGSLFAEQQVYRIDHYLGKETVQNLLAFRFANTLFEPVWNNNYVESVQIMAAETVALEGRGGYYETSGALRDMIQNHLLQVLCIVAMEPPVSFDADEIRNKKVEVLKAIRKWRTDDVPQNAVRGQYGPKTVDDKPVPGYRHEEGVSPTSMTETFAAVRLFCDNWRWRGVPFYIRTGKDLARKTTQIVVQFKPAPHYAFPDTASTEWKANRLVISIAPDMSIRMQVQAKRPGQTLMIDPVEMVFAYQAAFGEQQPEAYETLLWDALIGDATLFMRADQVDAAWEVVMPILDAWTAHSQPDAMPTYTPGSWGPVEADALTAQDGFRWAND